MTFYCFQKCGIEKLVDELCAKLKEIQSEGKHIQCMNFCLLVDEIRVLIIKNGQIQVTRIEGFMN
jgi:hypothetical protein